MPTAVRVIPTRANRIRAAATANPSLSSKQLAEQLGIERRTVEVALSKGDRRRIRSTTAPAQVER